MGAIIEIRRYVDQQTGEVISNQVKPLPDYLDPKKGYRMLARKKNVRIFPNIPFPKELTRTDMGHLLFLSRKIWAETGVLGDIINRRFRPFNDDRLIEFIGFKNRRSGKAWLKKMENLSMLRSIDVNLPNGEKERQWYMNPIYFCPMFITRDAYLKWRDVIEKYMPERIRHFFD